jgi:hypothetical protein
MPKWSAWLVTALPLLVVAVPGAYRGDLGDTIDSRIGHTVDVSQAPSATALARRSTPAVMSDDGASVAASLFAKGWFGTDPSTRRVELHAVCTPRLVGLHALSDPDEVPQAQPGGPPLLVRLAVTGVTSLQRPSSASAIAINRVRRLVGGPGWVVTGSRPGES